MQEGATFHKILSCTEKRSGKMAKNLKRAFEEVDNFDEISKEIPSASVHGVLTSISPVKKGRKQNYFEGTVSNGSSKLWLVGFDTKQQKQMADMMSKKIPIQIQNCEIKPSRRGEKMEILLKFHSSIKETTETFDVSDVEYLDGTPKTITLDELQSKHGYAKVTVDVKVQKSCDPETVRTGKVKQEVYIADSTSTARATLWEEHVGILHEETSNRLENFVVRQWGDTKYLGMGNDSKIVKIDDIARRCQGSTRG